MFLRVSLASVLHPKSPTAAKLKSKESWSTKLLLFFAKVPGKRNEDKDAMVTIARSITKVREKNDNRDAQ
jgi:hypothetical protein